MKESSTYQAILAEGFAAGLAEGFAAGLAEGFAAGLAEGRAAGLAEAAVVVRKGLRVGGERVLGPPDARTAHALERIDDLARLEELCNRLPTARSWRELLEPPAQGRRRGRRSP
jgi:hypothetical protein